MVNMKRADITKKNFLDVVSEAETVIRNGGIIAVPTDTVYGLIGDAANKETIKKIFLLKGRPKEKALPVFVKDIAIARRYAYISDSKAKVLARIWPGPVTVVFHHKEKLPKILTGNSDKVALRIPQGEFLQELLLRFDIPLVQTSANISGSAPAKTADEVVQYFGKKKNGPDLLIEGHTPSGIASTVIDFSGNEPILLRTGRVSREELQSLLGGFS